MPAKIEEPQYITIYHAIGWISGAVDSPKPIHMHEKIASHEKNKQKYAETMANLNSRIQSGELAVYGKSFPAIFSQQSTNNPNQPNVSLDYPDYEIDWNTSKLKLLPKIELDEDELKDFLKPIYSPADFKTIKASRELERETSWLLFSFNYLNNEFRNFYALDKHGLTIWNGHDGDSLPKDAIVELLFFKVNDLRRIFFPQQINPKKAGSHQKYFAEWSLLVLLDRSKTEKSDEDRCLIESYLKTINYKKLKESYDAAGPKTKKHLLSGLYKSQDTLTAILSDLIKSGLDVQKIIDISHHDFWFFVTDKYGSKRKLQDHFIEIKSCLQKISSRKLNRK